MRIGFRINKRDILATGLLCLLGTIAVLQVSAQAIWRLSGPSLIPVVIAAGVMLVGVMWLFDSRLSPDEEEIGTSKWRDTAGVVSGSFACVLLGKYGGLVPAIFAFVFISAMGDRRHSWRSAAILAAISTAIAALVVMLQPSIHMPLFRWG